MNYKKLFNGEFPKEYYDFLWGGIHSHNYEENQADYLINRYGVCRILDIGCSCGILVKTLRDRGCDAWGLEISKYAISESHVPKFIKSGSIDNIPFDDSSFDLAFSRGVIGYTKNLEKVISELRRVAKSQQHAITMDGQVPMMGYKRIEPKEWWESNFLEGIT